MKEDLPGELRSPGQGRPPDAPTIETIVPMTFFEIVKFDLLKIVVNF
jgi:hypothetical protein